jgi:hypothetical protein
MKTNVYKLDYEFVNSEREDFYKESQENWELYMNKAVTHISANTYLEAVDKAKSLLNPDLILTNVELTLENSILK